MASYPVTVYRWDDPGAPQIGNGRASDIINIWQKCLVEGYGTKLPLGWTRPYYDAARQRACYRNNVDAGGSGGYAIVFSNAGNDADYNLMRLSHAKTMSDIDTAVGQGFTKAFQIINGIGNLRRTKWVIIGTACAFYFMVSYDNFPLDGATNSHLPALFVGDFFSRVPNDAGRFVSECALGTSSDLNTTNNSGFYALNSIADIIGTDAKSLRIQNSDNSSGSKVYGAALHTYSYPSNYTITLENESAQILSPIGICEGGIAGSGNRPSVLQSSAGNTVNPYYRGQFPGIYTVFNPYRNDRSFPTIISQNGQNHWLLRTFWGAPATLINMEVWNDPFL